MAAYLLIGVFILLPMVFALIALMSWRQHSRRIALIAATPRETDAIVIRKIRHFSVAYRFHDQNRQVREATTTISRALWYALEEGGTLPVTYAETDPTISMPTERYIQAAGLVNRG